MRARSIAHVTCEFRNPSHAIHVLLDTGLTLRFAMLSSLRSVVMNRPYESLDDDPVHTPRHSSVQLNGKCVRHASHENLSTTRTIMYLPSTIRLHHGFMILAQLSAESPCHRFILQDCCLLCPSSTLVHNVSSGL